MKFVVNVRLKILFQFLINMKKECWNTIQYMTNDYDDNVLHNAASCNKPDVIDYFYDILTKAENEENENSDINVEETGEMNMKKYLLNFKKYSKTSKKPINERKNLHNFTPAMTAAFHGHYNCLKALNKFPDGINLTTRTIDEQSIFHLCVRNNHFKCFSYLISFVEKQTIDKIMKQTDNYGYTIVHLAALKNDLRILKFILLDFFSYVVEEGDTLESISTKHYGNADLNNDIAELNSITDDASLIVGEIIFMLNRRGHENMTKLKAKRNNLLHFVPISKANMNDQIYTVQKGDTLQSIAEAQLGLAHRWHEIYEINSDNKEVFHLRANSTVQISYLRLPKKFKDDHVDLVLMKNVDQHNCFQLACINGVTEVVDFFLKSNFSRLLMRELDNDFNTPLHLACLHQNEKILRLLFNDNTIEIDVYARNFNSMTPLDICCQHGNLNFVKMFYQRHGKEMNRIDRNQNDETFTSPIRYACMEGSKNLVDYLIKRGVDIEQLDKKGENILHTAIKYRHTEIIQLLLLQPQWKSLINENTKTQIFRNLTNQMPHMMKILLDNLVKQNDQDKKKEYECSIIDPRLEKINYIIEDHPLYIIAQSKNPILLNHEVIRKVADYKWYSRPVMFYYINLLLYFIFITCLTIHMNSVYKSRVQIDQTDQTDQIDQIDEIDQLIKNLTDYDESKNSNKKPFYENIVFLFIIYSLLAFHIIKEILQSKKETLKRHFKEGDNWFEFITYLFAFFYLYPNDKKSDLQLGLGSICIVTGWLVLTLFLQKMPLLGIYSIMYRKVLKKSFGVIAIFILMIVGFTTSFSMFETADKTFFINKLNTIAKMIGELNIDDMNLDESMFKQIVFFIFVSFMCIMLLNMLIGIAVGELKSMFDGADCSQKKMKIIFSLKVQLLLRNNKNKEASMIYQCNDERATTLQKIEEKFRSKFGDETMKSDERDGIDNLKDILINMNLNIEEKIDMLKANIQEIKSKINKINRKDKKTGK
jgi:ankyrin repeat protein